MPSTPSQQERHRVARLFHRAGFGADVATIDRFARQGYGAAVDHLLSFAPSNLRPDAQDALAIELKGRAEDLINGHEISQFQGWWLSRMATGLYPLEEKLTLYWHGHFATGFVKVKSKARMIHQNALLRSFAAGDFRAMLNAMTADPAMLIWLDGADNHAGALNENYGREFLELFTLGKGHYSQRDVVEAARAFTGYVVAGKGGASFKPDLHDSGLKTILGRRGRWGPADVTNIVLDHHPDGQIAARYVARRMATFFHHPDPEAGVVDAMARSFTRNNYDIRSMVRTLLLRPEFRDGSRLNIKSPAELVAGTMRALGQIGEGNYRSTTQSIQVFPRHAAAMGQALFNPPDVSGWKGGTAWVNTATSLARYNFAATASRLATDEQLARTIDQARGEPREIARTWMQSLGLLALSGATQTGIAKYLDARPTARTDKDRIPVARAILTLLLASSDHNLR